MPFIDEHITQNMNSRLRRVFRPWVTELEQELGAPVRVINRAQGGNGRSLAWTGHAWRGTTQDMNHYPGFTEADRDNNGFTICTYDYVQEFGREYPDERWQMPAGWHTHTLEGYDTSQYDTYMLNANHEAISQAGSDGYQISFMDGTQNRVLLVNNTLFTGFTWEMVMQYANFRDYPEDAFNFAPFNEFINESRDPELRAAAEQRREAQRQVWFHRALRDRGDSAIMEIRNTIEGAIVQKSTAEAQVVNLTATVQEHQRYLDVLLEQSDSGEVTREDADRELAAILAHASVESCEVREGVSRNPNTGETIQNSQFLDVYTTPMDIEAPNYGPVYLGKFKLTFDFGAQTVNIRNLDNAQGGDDGHGTIDHPHVRGGSLCAAEYQSTVTNLLRRREVASAVNIICHILTQVTERDDWGRAIRYFVDAHEVRTDEERAALRG